MMMEDSGAGSSGSGGWRQYINCSPDSVGEGGPADPREGVGQAEAPAPDAAPGIPIMELRSQVKADVLNFIWEHKHRIMPKANFVSKVEDELLIDSSDLRRLEKIKVLIHAYLSLEIRAPNGNKAKDNLLASLAEWEKNGRP